MTDDLKLTPVMIKGLQRMALKLKRIETCMAEPNDNTGRALVKRGLLEEAEPYNGWKQYRLTDKGRKFLAMR